MFLSASAFAQFTPRAWIIGQGGIGVPPGCKTKLDFTNGIMNLQSVSSVNKGITRTSASIADNSHPFLFYTNGCRIFNFNDSIIQN